MKNKIAHLISKAAMVIGIGDRTFACNKLEIFIDDVLIDTPESKNIIIQVEGSVDEIHTVSADVHISGNANSIKTNSGDVDCGNVKGDIKTVSGDVDCLKVSGSVSTISGDISHVV